MGQTIVQVDAFTNQPFTGNPAAVCVMERAAEEAWMQSIALEMNLSETAFLYPDGGEYQLRWFTPLAEVELCGHATLASAHVLFEEGHVPLGETIRFQTRSGRLTAVRDEQWIVLDFPATPAREVQPPEGLAAALGAAPRFVGQSRFDYLLELDSPEMVRSCTPDFARLASLPARGTIITSADRSGSADIVSRFFAPTIGINEDPVTGSAHCVLAPFWADRLGKNELRAYQASARGGTLRLQLDNDRVRIGGQAVTTMRGTLA